MQKAITAVGKGAYKGTGFVRYRIKPAPYEVVTESAGKEYDGQPLTAGGNISGLVNEETAALRTTGSLTDAGSVPNTWEIFWNGSAKEINYELAGEKTGDSSRPEFYLLWLLLSAGCAALLFRRRGRREN